MSWIHNLSKGSKVALAFACIFGLMFGTYWYLGFHAKAVKSEFQSIYHDRLIPSQDIAAMLERNYHNRLLVEEHILADNITAEKEAAHQIYQNDKELDSLLQKYEATVLVPDEVKGILLYKKQLQKLQLAQNQILHLSQAGKKDEAMLLFAKKSQSGFKDAVQANQALIHIQSRVGKQLYHAAEARVYNLNMLSYLFVAIMVLAGLSILSLLRQAPFLQNTPLHPIHLN